MSTELEVVAIGARTPVGLLAETSAAAVRAGISRLREFPFATPQGEPLIVGSDPRLEDALEGRARMLPMLQSAVDEACAKLGALDLSRGGCEVLLALPEARPGFSEDDAQWIARQTVEILRARRVAARVFVGGRGHAGVAACLERVTALAATPSPHASIYLVVGVDSYLSTQTFLWLEGRRQLSQPAIINGLCPGEAAGALVLVTRSIRQHLRLASLATVAGVGTAREPLGRDSETGSFGVGMSEAVMRAMAGLRLPSEAADAVYCDINGERYRTEEWGFFATRAHVSVRSLSYEAPSESWGDVGAAFGALGVVLAVQSFARGHASGPRALVMAGSESGLRGAVVVQAPEGWVPERRGGAS